ncbi:MAG: L-cystine ABC transporter ATP-binding protein YecC, partial [Vulcanimicrobiota bacterium]
ETDMTMLFVTHEMGFAREISDTIVFFDKGNVLEQAAPEALFTEPREERTRQFLEAVLSH